MYLGFNQSFLAQAEESIPSGTISFTAELFEGTCNAFVMSKVLKNTYVSNLPSLSSTQFLNDVFGPVTKIEISINTALNTQGGCSRSSRGFSPAKLIFDSDLAAIAPRTGLLVNSATLRPAQNVFVQLGLVEESGIFTPLDLNNPLPLNAALSRPNDSASTTNTLTLGIRYVASRSYWAQITNFQNDETDSQDVTAGNVSIFLPFLLKVN